MTASNQANDTFSRKEKGLFSRTISKTHALKNSPRQRQSMHAQPGDGDQGTTLAAG